MNGELNYQSIGDRATETTSTINKQIEEMRCMNQQKLNKKLAEWAGLHPRERSDGHTIQRINQPNFTDSLDACFKWLVPKAIKAIMAQQKCGEYGAYKILFKEWLQTGYDALALCLAIEKLIK